MKLYIVHIADIEEAEIVMVTKDQDEALQKQLDLYKELGRLLLIKVVEWEVE